MSLMEAYDQQAGRLRLLKISACVLRFKRFNCYGRTCMQNVRTGAPTALTIFSAVSRCSHGMVAGLSTLRL
jgi:hypothetical protein